MYSTSGYIPQQISQDRPARTRLTLSALVRVTGPDSERFLQGQLTCDVKSLTSDNWTAGACCNAKGRMVANFIIAQTPQGYLLRLPAEQADTLINHLKKYIVFFKSQISLAEDLCVIAEVPATATTADAHASQEPHLTLPHADGRREFWVTEEEATACLQGSQCSEADWISTEIRAGYVFVTQQTTEAWVPQYIGWHELGGISFSKGCYTGQEVVARLQYLGKAKKNLYLVDGNDDLPAVTAQVTADGRHVGDLAAVSGSIGLAVISSEERTLNATLAEQPVVLSRLFYTEKNQ